MRSLARDCRGSTSSEYVLVAALVALVAVAGWLALGDSVESTADCAAQSISSGGARGPCAPGRAAASRGRGGNAGRTTAALDEGDGTRGAEPFPAAPTHAGDDLAGVRASSSATPTPAPGPAPAPTQPPAPQAPPPPPEGPRPPCDLLDFGCHVADAGDAVAGFVGDRVADAQRGLEVVGDFAADRVADTGDLLVSGGSLLHGIAAGAYEGGRDLVGGTIDLLGAASQLYPDSGFDMFDFRPDRAQRMWNTVTGVANGVWQTVTHPVETGETLVAGGQALVGMAWQGLQDAGDTLMHGSPEEIGRLIGRAGFEIGVTVVPVTKIAQITKVAKLAEPLRGAGAALSARRLVEDWRLLRVGNDHAILAAELDGQPVAIKVALEGGDTSVAHIEAEAAIQEALAPYRGVPVVDRVRIPDGRPGVALREIDGISLREAELNPAFEVTEEHVRSIREIFERLERDGVGLDAGHAGNILLERGGGAWLIDTPVSAASRGQYQREMTDLVERLATRAETRSPASGILRDNWLDRANHSHYTAYTGQITDQSAIIYIPREAGQTTAEHLEQFRELEQRYGGPRVLDVVETPQGAGIAVEAIEGANLSSAWMWAQLDGVRFPVTEEHVRSAERLFDLLERDHLDVRYGALDRLLLTPDGRVIPIDASEAINGATIAPRTRALDAIRDLVRWSEIHFPEMSTGR